MQQPDAGPDPHRARLDVVVFIRVVRTGGFAGLTREWTAEPPPEQAPHWRGLIDECPWDDVDAAESVDGASAVRGADAFAWRISARLDDRPPRVAALADGDLDGPWRQLIDEVRAFGAADHPGRPVRDKPVSERPGR